MATDRFGIGTTARNPISYPDPTGNTAASNVDKARRAALDFQPADIAALQSLYDEAPGVMRADADRPLTNAHCIAALIAARIHTPAPLGLLLAGSHTPEENPEWENETNTHPLTTSWWDSEWPTSAA